MAGTDQEAVAADDDALYARDDGAATARAVVAPARRNAQLPARSSRAAHTWPTAPGAPSARHGAAPRAVDVDDAASPGPRP
ncbi:hypothetical protein SALBM217S_05002 [Streptomyces griseoloalbus]